MLTKLFVRKFYNQFNFQQCSQFSKLNHFFQQFEMDKYDTSSQIDTSDRMKFSKIIESMDQGKQSLFNSSLSEYLNTESIKFEQLLTLLTQLHQTNIFCNKPNQEILLQMINQNLKTINIGILQMISHSLSLGIANQQTLSLYLQHFITCDLKKFNYLQQFDMIFIISQGILKFKIDLSNPEFMNQWKVLLQLLKPHLEKKNEWVVKKYPHLAFIVRSISQDNTNNILVQDLINLFKTISIKFIQQQDLIYKLDFKEITILLSSVIKIRERHLPQELNILIENLIKYLLRQDLSKFNDSSLQSLALSLTQLPSYQSQFQELLIQQIDDRKRQGKINLKQHLSIIYELTMKWKNKVNSEKLVSLITSLPINEQSDFDLAHYFQILTILPAEQIINILKSIEYVNNSYNKQGFDLTKLEQQQKQKLQERFNFFRKNNEIFSEDRRLLYKQMQQQTAEDLAEKEAEIKEAFEIFDKNKSKSISVQELTSVFRSLGYNFSQDEIQSMVKELRQSQKAEGADDKELNFDDFKNLLLMQEEKAKNGEDDLRDAFEVFDRDANGYIGLEELMMVAKSLGENISEEDLKGMLQYAANTLNQNDDDKDKTPQINLPQFVEAYLK
ncbi:unnamed protein product [Paramecium sonneborni]|uniref:EF-hand domain-containing protein n=1 Tax=Paramecium sonneborni TaxID=65129 RepID=A0A8S1R0I7_9CILI|nr:unnamed protein product [Paramecium sonneborni]